jgi:hypothetical protein
MSTQCNKNKKTITPLYESHYVKEMTGNCTHRMIIQYPFETALLTRKNNENKTKLKYLAETQIEKGQIE